MTACSSTRRMGSNFISRQIDAGQFSPAKRQPMKTISDSFDARRFPSAGLFHVWGQKRSAASGGRLPRAQSKHLA
jgi:hypothetical protein